MGRLTWEEVLKREDLIGGDIEAQEDGDVYRGPLIKITQNGDLIQFSAQWMAKCDRTTGKWENWHTTSMSLSRSATAPQDIGGGRVCFSIPLLGVCTLFSKSGSKLDPQKVRGLPKEFLSNVV